MMTARGPSSKGLSRAGRRGIWAAVLVLVIVGMALGTKVVPNDSELIQGQAALDPEEFAAENFPTVQSEIAERAVAAPELAAAIADDADAAAKTYAVESSGGPSFSVTLTGVVGEGTSGIYEVAVDGVPDDLLIRVQTGPAINGTELRDATGTMPFGDFENQIEYQNVATALNTEMKNQVLSGVDTANLEGQTITLTGAFTLVNPDAWLITPSELVVK